MLTSQLVFSIPVSAFNTSGVIQKGPSWPSIESFTMYAGLFSNRWRKQYLTQARIALNQSEPDDCDGNAQPLWAERQTDYTGIDPLQCPNCDKPLTFVGCFFGNWTELQQLFIKAGKDSTIAAALLRPG